METAERSFSSDDMRLSEVHTPNCFGKMAKNERFSGDFGGLKEVRDVKQDAETVEERVSGGFPKELQTDNCDGKSSHQGLSGRFRRFTEVDNDNLSRKSDFQADIQSTNPAKNPDGRSFSGHLLELKGLRTANLDGKNAEQRFSGGFQGVEELQSENLAENTVPTGFLGNFTTFTELQVANPAGSLNFHGSTFRDHKTSKFSTKADDRNFSNVRLPRDPESESDKGTNQGKIIHSQVLKIREEDSHIGEDFGEGFSTKYNLAFLHLSSQMDAFFYSRPSLPSPLGTKTAVASLQ